MSVSPVNSPDDGDDDDYTIIGVRRSRHYTSFARRHASLTVDESLDLRELEEVAESALSVSHAIQLLVTTTLALIARLRSSVPCDVLSKTCRVLLALLTLCENELDVLTQVEVGIRALRLEDRPPLTIHPIKNRSIDDLTPDFAFRITRFTKE